MQDHLNSTSNRNKLYLYCIYKYW